MTVGLSLNSNYYAGCGAGVACAAAALSGSFTEVLGIELMVSSCVTWQG